MTLLRSLLLVSPLLAPLAGAQVCDYESTTPSLSGLGPVPTNPVSSFVPTTPLAPGEAFGSAVDIDGDRAVVAVANPNLSANNRAYVFEYDGTQWQETAVLPAPGSGDPTSVALSGDRIAIGVQGKVYVYQYQLLQDVWLQTQVLQCPAGFGNCATFGVDVALQGTYLAVGDPDGTNPQNGIQSGAAYIYEGVGSYMLVSSIYPPRTGAFAAFGGRLDFGGKRLVVAAKGRSLPGLFQVGSVFVYKRRGSNPLNISWNLEQLINHPAPPSPVVFFGEDVSMTTNRLVASSVFEDASGASGAGAVYVFKRTGTTWSFTRRLTASDASPFARFGRSLDLDGSRLLVGAPCEHPVPDSGIPCSTGRGSAYLFQEASTDAVQWAELKKMVLPAQTDGDRLGTAVALSGERAVAGAIQTAPETGSAHAFEAPVPDILASDYLLSASSGGTFTLEIDAGVSNAGRTYFVLGSEEYDVNSTSLAFPGCSFPLVLHQSGSYANSALWSAFGDPPPVFDDFTFVGFTGTLDSSGRATASFSADPGASPTPFTLPRTLYHTFGVYDAGGDLVYTGDLASVTVVP